MDRRMVEVRWNNLTNRYETDVVRESFMYTPFSRILSPEDDDAYQIARRAWMRRWVSIYGDRSDVWIEIPESRVKPIQNPTGHPVLCWSVFNSESNGVFCFVPFTAAINEWYGVLNAFV